MSSKKRLLELIREKSYRTGDFVLASGKRSSFYVDIKNLTLHPEGAQCIGVLAVERLVDEGLKVDAVGGLTLGADPIGTAVSLKALEKGLVWPAYIVRKESKGYGTGKYIEGGDNLKAGASVVVLEDVVTTGGSSKIAIERLREAGYKPVAVLTVVDREEGGRETLEKEGLKFLSLATLREVQNA